MRWEYMDITDKEVEIILACRIIVDNRRTLVKTHMDNFDVSMGAYN